MRLEKIAPCLECKSFFTRKVVERKSLLIDKSFDFRIELNVRRLRQWKYVKD
jgi:hypothetical protein